MRKPLAVPHKITSDTWDPDEAAWIKPRIGFMASQRVAYHSAHFAAVGDAATEEEALATVHHMTAVLLDLMDSWTFRDQSVPYEAGNDRPILALSAETLADLDPEDIALIYTEAMNAFAQQTAAPADVINEEAGARGLTPTNFRPRDADDRSVPGRAVVGG